MVPISTLYPQIPVDVCVFLRFYLAKHDEIGQVLTAMSQFTSNQVVNCPIRGKNSNVTGVADCTLGVSAGIGLCKKCRGYPSSSLLLARPGLTWVFS